MCKFKRILEKARYALATCEIFPRTAHAAQTPFQASEMAKPVIALRMAGFACNGAMAAKLWSRFSQDQCATWICIDDAAVDRFVEWIASELNPDEAWS